MAWSFKVGRVFGIDVKVHLIFVALVAWFSIDEAVSTGSILAGLQTLSILLLLFGFVLLHELAHSLMALRFGYRVHDITLWPLGGLARIEGGMDNPKSEFLIAAAGPATNLVLAALVYGAILAFGLDQNLLMRYMLFVNILMGLFNLVPAFPLDGGRILRAILARKMPHLRATEIAVRTGKVLAISSIIYAVIKGSFFGFSPLGISLICLFVLWAGPTELKAARAREVLRRHGGFGPFGESPFGETLDADVLSSSSRDPSKPPPAPTGKGDPENLENYEKDFINLIRRYGKKKE
jgi:Zn-dependent protease